ELVKLPGLEADIRQECELAAVDVLLKAKKFNVVRDRLAAAIPKLPPDSLQAKRFKVYLIGCDAAKPETDLAKVEPQLSAVLDDKASDPALRALALNALGARLVAKGRPADAMWKYLWVDAVYFQDRAELAKAAERLAKLFEERGDNQRAERYKDKLKTLR